MTDAAATAEPAPRDLRAARAERRLEQLDELAGLGMEVARELRRQLLEQEGSAPELALAFDRVSRGLRLTFMLQEKLGQAHEARDREATAEAARREREAQWEALRERSLKAGDVLDAVLDIVDEEATSDETIDVEVFRREADERLDREVEDPGFLDRPLGEIVAGICHDLGLQPDWSLWDEEPWAEDAARVEPPAEPRPRPQRPQADIDADALLDQVLDGMRRDRAPP